MALLLAFSYATSQAELFQEEYAANHPVFPTSLSFARSSVTSETIDKDDAVQVFVVDPALKFVGIVLYPPERPSGVTTDPGFQLIRDKSPPRTSVATAP
jgi:hypothetical protein